MKMKAAPLLAMATAVLGSQGEHDANTMERRASVSQLDYANINFYAQHAAASYCNSDRQAGQLLRCSGSCPAVEANRAAVVASFVGSLTGVGGYVAVDDVRREIVLALRGTNNLRNFITDAVFALQDCPLVANCQVHAGFASSWNEVSAAAVAAINAARRRTRGYRLVVTGHSLGGAVATLAAAYLRRAGYPVDAYTYGSPRVGNEAFANLLTRQGRHWRVTHAADPFPCLPPILAGFRHVSPEYWLSGGSASQDNYAMRDVKVCYGVANVDCNASTLDFALDSHMHYLCDMGGCAASAFQWKRSDESPSHEELEQRFREWSRLDQAYVENLRYYYEVEAV